MTRVLRWLGLTIAGLGIAGVIGWWAIGPTWRLFLSDPPTATDVLFWTQSQRDSGFALVDQIPFIDTVPVASGGAPRALEMGPPLSTDYDIDAFMARQNSAALVVLHNGAIRFEAYGLNQTAESRWTSFSVAKSITSTLVGVALAQGHIESLDDTVSTYVSGLQGSAYDDVTIRQLLTMTSGVAWDEDYSDPNSDVARFNDVERVAGEPAIVTYLRNLPRAHPPGEVYNYSTGETNLVGLLVEAATGVPLNQYLSDQIWQPYGMTSDASWVTAESGEPISGCCLQATARDFARFGQFILDRGRIGDISILPEGWLDAATQTQVQTDRSTSSDYGFQWWTRDDGSFTANGIFGQFIFIDPARQLVIAGNASWQDARGIIADQSADRTAFYSAMQAAIDEETR